MKLSTVMRAAEYANARRAQTVNIKADETTPEYRPCCGKVVRRCPHGFRLRRGFAGANRARRRWLRFTKAGREELRAEAAS